MEQSVAHGIKISVKLRSPDEETRRTAVGELGAFPLAEVKEYLAHAMGDSSWRVRKEAVDILLKSSVDEDFLETLVGLLSSGENAGLRNSAVEALERLGEASVPILSRHISDPDPEVRKFVIDILGTIGDVVVVPLLVNALEDPDHNVCAAAAETLGKIADPRGVAPLVEVLKRNDLWLSFTVLEALGKIGKPVAFELIAPLAGENLLKKAVYDCLGAIGGEEAVSLLMAGLKEKARNVREASAVALIRIRERLPRDIARETVDLKLMALKGSPFVDSFIGSVESSDRVVKEAAVTILGLIGDERATGTLLDGCRDGRLRKYCLLAFESMGEAGIAALADAFPTTDDDGRCFIAYICGEFRYSGSSALLRMGIHGESPELRKVSAGVAGRIGLVDLIDDLVALLDDSDNDVQKSSVEALCRLAQIDREPVRRVAGELIGSANFSKRGFSAVLFAALNDAGKLSQLVKDEEPVVRMSAVEALAKLKSPEAVSHLVITLADEDVDVRIATAGALGEIGGDKVIKPLLLALEDENSWVACAALKSLGRLRNQCSLPSIFRIIEKSDGLRLISALQALAEIGGESVLDTMKAHLDNPDEEVVKVAIEILSGFGNGWIDQYAEKLLHHPHWDVRRSFVRAMSGLAGQNTLVRLRSVMDTETDDLVKDAMAELLERLR